MKYQKITKIVVNNVLAFLKPFASKTLSRAIEILLTPCCTLTGEAEVACNDDNTWNLTITTNEQIGFLGNGVASVLVDGNTFTGVITEPKTIYFESVDPSVGTHDADVSLFLPVNTAGNVGVFKTFTVVDVVFPSCV